MSYTAMLILNTLLMGNFKVQDSNQLVSFQISSENRQMVAALNSRGLLKQSQEGILCIYPHDLERHLAVDNAKDKDLLNYTIAAGHTTSYR
jgi:hypothetical protein